MAPTVQLEQTDCPVFGETVAIAVVFVGPNSKHVVSGTYTVPVEMVHVLSEYPIMVQNDTVHWEILQLSTEGGQLELHSELIMNDEVTLSLQEEA